MAKATKPLVIVVIPAYRAEGTIARAIKSVQAQRDVVFDIIVVVDGSFDRTTEVAESFEQVRVLVNQTNQGAPAARNRGLFAASSDYIMFLDADDYIQPPLLESLVKTIEQTKADICFGRCMLEFPDGSLVDCQPPDFASRLSLIEGQLSRRSVVPCCILWRRAYVASIGGWNEQLLKDQDTELVIRALLNKAMYSWTESGRGVYCQTSAPSRVSRTISRESMSSQLWVLSSVKESLEKEGYLPMTLKATLAKRYAATARICFHYGYSELGRKALDQAKILGDWMEGSLFHRAAVFVLGLEYKERLAKKLHSLKVDKTASFRAQKASSAR
jgi:glycosyltransferase involved in cell wall biosynthesis